ncbi:MAG: DUF1761 domain-containing protein [Lewinellaceae bacterium]|nr:DUF1761 domain-containing protein [Lewinella sp.]MCB9279426.1 DUF1761 domain-containing protein [Lewinellaceae bacterium]
MEFSSINYLAVLVAGVASFALGALWYSPVLFSKTWQKEVGLSDADMRNGNIAKTFGLSFVLMVVMALGMAMLLNHVGKGTDFMDGLKFGLAVGAFFSATSIGINYLYQRKSLKLWLIDAVYQIVFLGITGGILGAWH